MRLEDFGEPGTKLPGSTRYAGFPERIVLKIRGQRIGLLRIVSSLSRNSKYDKANPVGQ